MKSLESFNSEERHKVGTWSMVSLRPPVLMRFLQFKLPPPDSHSCLFQERSIAHGLALHNPTKRVNDKREERGPALLPGCA